MLYYYKSHRICYNKPKNTKDNDILINQDCQILVNSLKS